MTRTQNLHPYLDNRLEDCADSAAWLAGIIGDRPSQHAKSPSLWNAAFKHLEMDAVYVPFDVTLENLKGLVNTLRHTDGLVGFSVTAPYKIAMVQLLDEVDPKARQIGAVNMVVRHDSGRLVGFNTDGQGLILSLTRRFPGGNQSFLETLENMRILLIGAGGAARAAAVYLAEAIGPRGQLLICNRNQNAAQDLVASVNQHYGNGVTTSENDLQTVASDVDVIINASSKGQLGLRKLPDHRITCLEPYSALGPAHPAEFIQAAVSSEQTFYLDWYKESRNDIEENFRASNRILCRVPGKVAFVDLIYAPTESVMLRQARLSGHAILNGRGMNIAQAVDGFVNRVMRSHFREQDAERAYQRVFETMARVW